MIWRVGFTPRAAKEFAALEPRSRERIGAAIARLADDPQSAPNVKALRGGGYRLRVGDWRVLYHLLGDALVVLVIAVAHPREVYRR